MPKLKISTNKTLVQLKTKLSRGEKVNDRELEFLSSHYICGLFKISFDGKKTIQYTAPLSVSLQKYLTNRVPDEAEFWRLIAQIVEIAHTVELNGLYQSHLILDKQTVFVNETTRELYFIYQPVDSPQISANALALLRSITYDELKKGSGETKNYLVRFEQFLEQHYHMEQIRNYIEQVYPQVYATVQRADSGKSGFITTNPLEYKSHYESERAQEDFSTVCLQEEEQGTMLLTDDEAGTTLLADDEEGTTLLVREKQLVLIRRKDESRITVSGQAFRLGKSSQNDYCIDGNTAVSRKHAVINRQGVDYYLSDLNSTNGTQVNGSRLEPGQEVLLKNGDELVLADEEFRVEVD